MADSRQRATASLKVKYKSATLGQFIQQFGLDISHAGIFIKTKSPLEPGAMIRLELQLSDGSPVISGSGRVTWRRKQSDESQPPPGMGIEFIRLESESRSLVDRIVDGRDGRPSRFEQTDGAEVLGQSEPTTSSMPSARVSQPGSMQPGASQPASVQPASVQPASVATTTGAFMEAATPHQTPPPAVLPGPVATSSAVAAAGLFVSSPWRSTATIETIDPIAESSAQSSFFSHGRGVSRPIKPSATSARAREVEDKLIDDLFSSALPQPDVTLAATNASVTPSSAASAPFATESIEQQAVRSTRDDDITREFREPTSFAEDAAITDLLAPPPQHEEPGTDLFAGDSAVAGTDLFAGDSAVAALRSTSPPPDAERYSAPPSLRLELPSQPPTALAGSRPLLSPVVIGSALIVLVVIAMLAFSFC